MSVCVLESEREREGERGREWERVDAELLCGVWGCGVCINEKREKGHRTEPNKWRQTVITNNHATL